VTGEGRRVIAAGTAREFEAGAPEARVTSEGDAGYYLLGRRRGAQRPTSREQNYIVCLLVAEPDRSTSRSPHVLVR
jgi:hypothetical protein